jgi:VWFA-related protein
MNEDVIELLENFAHNRRDCGRQLSNLLKADPAGFQQSVVRYMCNGADESTVQYVIWLLQSHGILLDLLLNPGASSVVEAVELARVIKGKADRLDIHLARALKEASGDKAARILRILAEVAENNRTLPLLTHSLRQRSSELRSKAGRIFAQHCQNELFAQNALKDPDAAVRASAVEGMGLRNQGAVPEVLLSAVFDPDHRVQAHAVLACYRLGHPHAMQWLHDLAKHPEARFRSGAVWAMGETSDPACLPIIEKLEQDPDEEVRAGAEAARQKFEVQQKLEEPVESAVVAAESEEEEVHSDRPLTIEVLHAAVLEKGDRILHMGVSDPQGTPVEGIQAKHFTVHEDARAISEFEVLMPPECGPMNLAFVLDNSGSMSATDIQDENAAVVWSLKHKREEDRFAIYKFSMDIACTVPFTDDPKRITTLIRRPHTGPKTASRLHDAVRAAVKDLASCDGGKAIVAIVDSSDRGSEASLPKLIRVLRTVRMPLYIVGFDAGNDDSALRSLAEQTGGQYFDAPKSRDLNKAVQTIVRQFSQRCTLRYHGDPEVAPQDIRLVLRCPGGSSETSAVPMPG